MELPELDKLVAGSEYEQHIECIGKVLGTFDIKTTLELENAVRFIGPRLCGISTNAFISYAVAWCKNPPPDPVAPVVEKKPKRKTTRKKKKVVIDVPEFAVEAQDDNDNAVEDALIPE